MNSQSILGRPTRRKIGIAAVAERAGVSVTTVSRVLNGITHKNSAATARAVREAAAALDYRPAPLGRALRTDRTRLIALLVPDPGNLFYAAIVRAIETSFAERNFATVLCNTNEQAGVQDRYLAEMEAYRVEGIVVLGAVPSPRLEQAVHAGLPIVFVNRPSPHGPASFVGIDNFAAGQQIGAHFIERGLVDCAVIGGPAISAASAERLRGFCERLQTAGIVLPDDRIVRSDLTMAAGHAIAGRMLSSGRAPRAIFCGNDQIAYGAYRRCRELDVGVPQQLALFGFDDNPLNEWLAPWLSTVHVPTDAFGPAIRLALERQWVGQGDVAPERHLLDFTLKLRTSA